MGAGLAAVPDLTGRSGPSTPVPLRPVRYGRAWQRTTRLRPRDWRYASAGSCSARARWGVWRWSSTEFPTSFRSTMWSTTGRSCSAPLRAPSSPASTTGMVAFEVDGDDADEVWSVVVKGRAVPRRRAVPDHRRHRASAVPVAGRSQADLRQDRSHRGDRPPFPARPPRPREKPGERLIASEIRPPAGEVEVLRPPLWSTLRLSRRRRGWGPPAPRNGHGVPLVGSPTRVVGRGTLRCRGCPTTTIQAPSLASTSAEAAWSLTTVTWVPSGRSGQRLIDQRLQPLQSLGLAVLDVERSQMGLVEVVPGVEHLEDPVVAPGLLGRPDQRHPAVGRPVDGGDNAARLIVHDGDGTQRSNRTGESHLAPRRR